MLTLTVTARSQTGKAANALRKEGVIPAVVYGPKIASTPISVSEGEFIKLLREAGETTLITLKGLPEEHEALVQEVDLDPVSHTPRHVDFFAVERGKAIEVTVPLEFIGVSPAVKNLGAQLVKVLHEVDVKTTPGKIPQHIDVDISTLEAVEDQIHVHDIALPTGVEMLNDANDVVVLAQAPREEEPEETQPIDMASIEVEKKGKSEEEGEENQ